MASGNRGGTAAGAGAAAPLQLALFDDRRSGSDDEDPSDQLLAFYPQHIPAEDSAGAVGLMRAVMAFTSIFTEDGAQELAMDAQRHRWVSHTAEPHLCLLLVAEASWCGPLVRDAALRAALTVVHMAIRLLHGSIQQLLNQVPLEEAREALASILGYYGDALAKGSAPHVLELGNPLSPAAGIPFFPLTRRTFTGLQAACEGLLLLPLRHDSTGGTGGEAVSGIVAMCGRHCLWSSVGTQDTAALVSLATGALLPHHGGGVTAAAAWKKLKGAALATAGRSPSPAKQRPSRVPLDASAWTPSDDGFLHLAAPAVERLTSPTVMSDDSSSAQLRLPLVHLQDGGDTCQLLPMQHGGALLLLLMSEDWRPTAEAQAALAAAAAGPLQRLTTAAAAEVAAAHDGHVKGFRYLHTDGVLGSTRASPAVKTATLHRDSAALTATVRQQIDERLAASPHPPEDADLEVVARGAGDCWVSARVNGQRSLTVVMESRGEGGLQEASVTAAHFAVAQFPGIF